MEKTIHNTDNYDWTQTDAYSSDNIPLDLQMGAGALNAKRALKQFKAGRQQSTQPSVPVIGWDFSTIFVDTARKYVLGKPLEQNSYISITLAWDRDVRKDQPGAYAVGHTFTDHGLPNLDLYLVPKGATNINQAVAASTSTIYSVEHIFWQIQTTGEYEIWVYCEDEPGNGWDYGLAWWAVAFRECPADINDDGVVGTPDLLAVISQWGPAECGNPADLNYDGMIGTPDMLAVISSWGPCYGACCLPTGICVQKKDTDCTAEGGEYMGHMLCSAVTCTGACCLPSGICDELTHIDCDQQGGEWRGSGSMCKSTCPSTGACCFADGSCQSGMTESACDQAGGHVWTPGAGCVPNECPSPTTLGHCCIPNSNGTEACQGNMQLQACHNANGRWKPGTSCFIDDCYDCKRWSCENGACVLRAGCVAFECPQHWPAGSCCCPISPCPFNKTIEVPAWTWEIPTTPCEIQYGEYSFPMCGAAMCSEEPEWSDAFVSCPSCSDWGIASCIAKFDRCGDSVYRVQIAWNQPISHSCGSFFTHPSAVYSKPSCGGCKGQYTLTFGSGPPTITVY